MTIWILPTLFMFGNSFSPSANFSRDPPALIPDRLTLQHYQTIFALKLLPRWTLNSLIIAVVQVSAGIIINGAAGYVAAFCRRRWVKYVFWTLMLPIFVSGYVLLVSQFVIVGRLGLRGLPAVYVMGIFWPTGIYLFRNYFRTIPLSLLESARMDGAGEITMLLRIILPLSGPIVGLSVVLTGMGAFTAFLWPYLNLRVPEQQTFLVGIMLNAVNVYAVKDVGRDLAIGCMAFVPYLVIFALASKYFIGGLTVGAIKE
ncbi:MAG: carbohydrate ABC transporter permease [Gallionellaceae bacterium]|nr:carbohydrate ABC transporter permease [Gallionellaceae bacterium]